MLAKCLQPHCELRFVRNKKSVIGYREKPLQIRGPRANGYNEMCENDVLNLSFITFVLCKKTKKEQKEHKV